MIKRLLLPLVGFTLLAGCTFSRVVENDYVKDFDTSWIVPGTTTRDEVVAKFGYPVATQYGRGGIFPNAFYYACNDVRTFKMVMGYILTPTFERTRGNSAHEIMLKFDDRDIVKIVSRIRRDADGQIEVLDLREAK